MKISEIIKNYRSTSYAFSDEEVLFACKELSKICNSMVGAGDEYRQTVLHTLTLLNAFKSYADARGIITNNTVEPDQTQIVKGLVRVVEDLTGANAINFNEYKNAKLFLGEEIFPSREKVLFLDIDGVLNCWDDATSLSMMLKRQGTYKNYTDADIEKRYIIFRRADFVSVKKLNLLKYIIEQTSCEVVGVSSWFTSGKVQEIAEFLGIKIIGCTDCTGGGTGRSRSINKYILDNNVKRSVVLDDQEHIDVGPHVRPERSGLTDVLAEQCIKILNGE